MVPQKLFALDSHPLLPAKICSALFNWMTVKFLILLAPISYLWMLTHMFLHIYNGGTRNYYGIWFQCQLILCVYLANPSRWPLLQYPSYMLPSHQTLMPTPSGIPVSFCSCPMWIHLAVLSLKIWTGTVESIWGYWCWPKSEYTFILVADLNLKYCWHNCKPNRF